MLKFQSFKLSDSDGINAFLEKNILAKGSTVFHSQGEILLPYEDGLVPNKAQQILLIKELQIEQQRQLDIMIHSQRVLDTQVMGITKEITRLEAELETIPKDKKSYKANKDIENEIKRLEGVRTQTQNTILTNQAELTRLVTNISVFDAEIKELSDLS